MKRSIHRLTALTVMCAMIGGIVASGVTAATAAGSEERSYAEEARQSENTVMERRVVDNYAPQVSLYINGNAMQETSYLINDTTYVPLRAFSENMGECEIGWDDGVATVKTDTLDMQVRQNSNYLEANERILYNSNPILNIDSRIYVPVRSLAKAYSLDVTWEGSTRTVYLAGNPKGLIRGKEYYDENDLYWLSRIIQAESGGEVLRGKIAVGNVVINRKNRSDYPDTIYGVIFDKKYGTQFSPVSFGTIYNTPSAESIKAAKICLEGFSLNDEMIFFINPRIATNLWVVQQRKFVMRIGNHDFYK